MHVPIERLAAGLPPSLSEAMSACIEAAQAMDLVSYLVGGPVRDLLLERKPNDLDIVLEGDAIAVAKRASERSGLRLRFHERFGTATLLGDDFALDLVTARRERYSEPAALPQVQPASLDDDLRRRDFTINAMATALSGPRAGWLIDPTGGVADLRAQLVRVIHERSFIDDPTRLLRGVRYAARFAFQLDTETAVLVERDRPYLALLTADRLRHEIERLLAEEDPAPGLALAERYGLLTAIDPAWRLPPLLIDAIRHPGTSALPRDRQSVMWGILGAAIAPVDAERIAGRLHLAKAARDAWLGAARLTHERALARARPSDVAERAESETLSAIWGAALASSDNHIRSALRRYLDQDRHVRPLLRPADLIAMGVPEGPAVGRCHRALRIARWDGLVSTKDDELAFVRRECGPFRNEGEEA